MRVLLRVVLILAVIVAGAFLALGYWAGRHGTAVQPESHPIGTAGSINTERARERGAELGEKAATAAAKAEETVSEAALTAKIKAKMALDDSVKSRTVDVTTNGTTVTLTGTVDSIVEHDRAVALARETAGVTKVVDHLTVAR
jgi:hyperosmotically inducible periplasmic protein